VDVTAGEVWPVFLRPFRPGTMEGVERRSLATGNIPVPGPEGGRRWHFRSLFRRREGGRSGEGDVGALERGEG
jgi:hypothetical protein